MDAALEKKRYTYADVLNWDVSQVHNFAETFKGASKLADLDLSKWDMTSGQSRRIR